jgi:hypothetical protein
MQVRYRAALRPELFFKPFLFEGAAKVSLFAAVFISKQTEIFGL